jgi:hypothetical protein
MKKIITMAVLLALMTGVSSVYGQEKEKEETEASKEQENKLKELERQRYVVKEELRDQVREAARAESVGRATYSISSGNPAPSFITAGDGFVFTTPGGSSSSQLSMSKTFKGESKKNEGSFEVDENVHSITLVLKGSVDKGEIKIKITLSNGDVFKELTIDESADIQFNQNIKIKDEDDKYFGKWKYTVQSVAAEGDYRLMISTR